MTNTQESDTLIELTASEKKKRIHTEQTKEYMRERYRTVYGPNRDKTKRILCGCGEHVLEANAARHRRSKKCINMTEKNSNGNI